MAFGLKQLIDINATQLADAPIYRADKVSCGQGACTGF